MTPLSIVGLVLVAAPLGLLAYAYAGYPVVLMALAAFKRANGSRGEPTPSVALPVGAAADAEWPEITITVPAYNEERSIGATIENLLAADYPAAQRRILVVSDASSDGTDAIVSRYADRNVELLRLPARGGKTAAENAAARHVRSGLIVNTDASVRVRPDALKPLVRAFADASVGVASGRDVSTGDEAREGNRAESGYVGYEMWVRALETRVSSIIGASGCFYAFRREVYQPDFPAELSRDFASVLIAREHGYRAVSVDDAVCLVPRTISLQVEFRRKIRTMARGLATLWYKRALLNPWHYGAFAFMLASHKLVRWLFYASLPLSVVGLVLLVPAYPAAVAVLIAALAGIAVGTMGLRWSRPKPPPRVIALAGFAWGSALAGMLAWWEALRGRRRAVWEPTRRP